MNEKGFIKYIVIIAVILAVVFASQQAFLKENQKTFVYGAMDQGKAYLAKGSEWVTSKIYPKISEEAQKRGEAIKNGVDQEKNKISENIGEKISNYFSGVADSVLHPGTPQNCPTQPTQTQPNP
ncbi:MAG: hypothetical protein A2358_00230 [Candidatus Staskawiczbacteria bacterium RIFOXYB1_FULL_37_44]|uniref:Uncharacterized protein n=1 Tax=Candidatus Staskawiczbacteria bacterium RIFOXYB1_FULL_37_44 TaxID=1802223 RepID=A0A1G2IX21_9BACT|nr:MAG: hypothetical protein A2358_00230 [Candidatus Staskawiczbacteria bacterium RIFOXYB1_FULL_37_44]OGZ83695.1 MAG: hypothetical protein A2416_03780 [Candidatus Staskawiczbacteria bacterium RIFOXYC1_FULL_37_52]OGZ87204.1 MAG: hypothetical protein A2444_02520 [Candidatus Staskawiczbacteria bacterium RIFOXYC2_FULL_37_19]OGZ90219.1 MAG: hypothetical protein A2581_02310 [Candidatus Staskawiczbacteria bacterium RIFOXYD1_FULL_37_110]